MDCEHPNLQSNYRYKFSGILRRIPWTAGASPPSYAIIPPLYSHRNFARSKASEMPLRLPPPILLLIPVWRFIFLSFKSDQMKVREAFAVCNFSIKSVSFVSSNQFWHVAVGLKCPTEYLKRMTKDKLLEVYHVYVNEFCEHRLEQRENFERIAFAIIKDCLEEKCQKSRFQNLELLLGQDLFPSDVEMKSRVRHWIKFSKFFSPSDKKVLVDFLFEKQRFQMLMEDYLEKRKDNSSREELLLMMSNYFPNSSSALSCFRTLDKMKDDDIFKALNYFVHERRFPLDGWPNLKKCMERMNDKHDFCAFVKLISLKSSYSIFSSESVVEIFFILYDVTYSSRGDSSGINFDSTFDVLYACLNVYPHLLEGSEWEFMRLFTVECEIFMEGFLCMLSRLDHRLCIPLSDIFVLLKRICLDGTPTQATYAVSIIGSLTDASHDQFIHFLWKELVGALDNGSVSATVVQSVKCVLELFPSQIQRRWGVVSNPVGSQHKAVRTFSRKLRSGCTARRLKFSQRSALV